jgi:hypothetical protein
VPLNSELARKQLQTIKPLARAEWEKQDDQK